MQFMVDIPDNADPKVVDSLESSIEAAGGTWQPLGPQGPEENMEPTQEPGEMGNPAAALAAGPGAGMSPGSALANVGARALRPR